MTLRTKGTAHTHNLNQVFSDLLFLQTKELPEVSDLRADGPLFHLLPPKVIKSLLRFLEDPSLSPEPLELNGLHFACFANVGEALSARADLTVRRGQPFAVGEFLLSPKETTLFDFAPLGAVILSTHASLPQSSEGVHHHVLLPFLHYATGPDLWGPQGKWTRFHERLHVQFEKLKLLKDDDLPGRYSLDLAAQRLESHGFRGDHKIDRYDLTMPWTFSLSELKKLEEVLAREF